MATDVVVAVGMMRDEADIAEPVVRHMRSQVDHVIVADNRSSDGTRDILDTVAHDVDGVTVLDDPDPAHYQSRKITALAHLAADTYHATWVVPFDADEIWYSPHAATVRDWLAGIDAAALVEAVVFDHVATADDDPHVTDPTTRIGWRRRRQLPLPKVAARVGPDLLIADGNHNATWGRWTGTTRTDGLTIRHFPYRSAEQMVRKAVNGSQALAATDLPDHVGAHWRDYANLAAAHGTDTLRSVFWAHFHSQNPHLDPGMIYDPAPVNR